jgi:hypothetical protein
LKGRVSRTPWRRLRTTVWKLLLPSIVVTIYTTSFNILKATILPTEYMHVIYTDSFPKQNRLNFIKETSCVLCGAGAEFVYILQIYFSLLSDDTDF